MSRDILLSPQFERMYYRPWINREVMDSVQQFYICRSLEKKEIQELLHSDQIPGTEWAKACLMKLDSEERYTANPVEQEN